mmetsp:Transcript_12877/g.24985  ORF Transcript_12877/g.24985 Transcript_12877/m.24985 type:complete len:217 (+) Transcript_12877:3213-3863(+)
MKLLTDSIHVDVLIKSAFGAFQLRFSVAVAAASVNLSIMFSVLVLAVTDVEACKANAGTGRFQREVGFGVWDKLLVFLFCDLIFASSPPPAAFLATAAAFNAFVSAAIAAVAAVGGRTSILVSCQVLECLLVFVLVLVLDVSMMRAPLASKSFRVRQGCRCSFQRRGVRRVCGVGRGRRRASSRISRDEDPLRPQGICIKSPRSLEFLCLAQRDGS